MGMFHPLTLKPKVFNLWVSHYLLGKTPARTTWSFLLSSLPPLHIHLSWMDHPKLSSLSSCECPLPHLCFHNTNRVWHTKVYNMGTICQMNEWASHPPDSLRWMHQGYPQIHAPVLWAHGRNYRSLGGHQSDFLNLSSVWNMQIKHLSPPSSWGSLKTVLPSLY